MFLLQALLAAAILAGAASGEARAALLEFKVVASDGEPYDEFGRYVALDGQRMAVGAIWEDDKASSAGAVYVFERNASGWVETAKLTADDGLEGDKFGRAVAISGNTILVGAYRVDANGIDSGALYTFDYIGGAWLPMQKLVPPDNAAFDVLGESVAMDGNTLVAGAYTDDLGVNAGAAYVYERVGSTWVYKQKLLAADGVAGDYFGQLVAISGDTIAVGAPFHDLLGSESGAVYVFERAGGTWTQTAKLTASGGAAGDWFGFWVAVDGATIIASSPLNSVRGAQAGAVYAFEKQGGVWTQTQRIFGADTEAGDGFGYSVAVRGDLMVATAVLDDDGAPDAGSAYLFRRGADGQWREISKVSPSDPQAEGRFGWSASLLDGKFAVGAIWNPQNGYRSGAAYIYELPASSAAWRAYE